MNIIFRKFFIQINANHLNTRLRFVDLQNWDGCSSGLHSTVFISGADNKGFVASESDPATTTAPPAPATTVTVTDESAKAEAPKEEAKEETTEKKEE